MEDFLCPVSLEWFVEPVIVPCCGRSFSRKSIRDCLAEDSRCPICRMDIPMFNADAAPLNRVLANLVEEKRIEAGDADTGDSESIEAETEDFTVKLNVLNKPRGENSDKDKKIGLLKIKCNNKKIQNDNKSLVLLIVDNSGSMNGQPIEQVRFALKECQRMASRNKSSVKIVMLAYNSTCAMLTDPDTLRSMGGTNMESSFDLASTILDDHNGKVSSVNVVFMTDGQDESIWYASSKDLARKQLINKFRKRIQVAKYPVAVHTIGFGANHDSELLQQMSNAGQVPGVYRYANPSENSDILSAKIGSVTRVVIGSAIVPITVNGNKTELADGEVTVWFSGSFPEVVSIVVGDEDKSRECPVTNVETCDHNLWIKWYSHLTDRLIAESIEMNDQRESLHEEDLEIFGLLLSRRAKHLLKLLRTPAPDGSELEEDPETVIDRLESALATINAITKGEEIDRLKLVDMKHEGKYKTNVGKISGTTISTVTTSSFVPPPPVRQITIVRPPIYHNETGSRYNGGHDLFRIICQDSWRKAMELIDADHDLLSLVDDVGNSPLAVAVSIGKRVLVTKILEIKKDNIDSLNHKGMNAMDLATVYGYWKMYDLLKENGAHVKVDEQLVMNTCLSNGHTNTADRLLGDGVSTLRKESVDWISDPGVASWIMANAESDIPTKIRVSIEKGIFSNIQSLEEHIDHVKFSTNIEHFDSANHYRIVKFLLDKKKMDPNEEWNILDDDGEAVTYTPLIWAAKKGNMPLVKLLRSTNSEGVPYSEINKKNNHGTTALWMASSNKRTDVVLELISKGADPNICNNNGDPPLIPSAHMGTIMIARILIDAGASVDLHNPERCNAVLIACQNGHSEMVDLLLNQYEGDAKREVLLKYAEIDGFDPLFASTELNRASCIQVVYDHSKGVIDDYLTHRTGDDNKILPGASALHLACYYCRMDAAKLLIELGIDVNITTIGGEQTPLHIAAAQGNFEMFSFLMNECETIDKNKVDAMGRTPKYYAQSKGNERLYYEFYHNPLSESMVRLIHSGRDKSTACSILELHGEHNEIVSLDCNPLSRAIQCGDIEVRDSLLKMGADLHAKDHRGLTPEFWKTLVENTASSDEMVTRVRSIMNKEIQNKLLLNIEDRPSKFTDFECKSDILVKMSDGDKLNSKIKTDVLDILRGAEFEDQSLLGFIEGCNKLISYSSPEVSQMIWNAKVHVVGSLAKSSDLQPNHLLAIYLFSAEDEISCNTNSALVKWQRSKSPWKSYIFCLYDALQSIPPLSEECECYRRIDTNFVYREPGTEVQWNSFTTATTDWGNTLFNKGEVGQIYIIKSKSGRYIGDYSKNPQNSEVIFLPGTRFKIIGYHKYNMVVFGQANIRHNESYLANDKYLAKAELGKLNVVITIEEIE